jgi:hypothetical protein
MRVIPNGTAGLKAPRDVTHGQRANRHGEAYGVTKIGISSRVPGRRNVQHHEHESKCEQESRQKRRPIAGVIAEWTLPTLSYFMAAAAIAAPKTWNTMYGATSFAATRPRTQTTNVTAGL